MLELHARGLQLRHLAERLHPMPDGAARHEHRSAAGGGRVSFPAPRRLPWLLLISLVVFVADRLTKIWVSTHIALGGAIPIIPRVLRISHWTNEGAAFSMFANSASPQ